MSEAIERRVIEEFGPELGAGMIELAAIMGTRPSADMTKVQPVTISVTRSDARAAGGAELIRHTVAAVAALDSPDVHATAREVIEALKSIASRTAAEGGLAGLFVAMERAAMDCLRVARLVGFDTPLGATMLGRAEKLACRAIEASEAIARRRNGGKQTIVVQHIRAAQAVGIGVLAKGETR
jgi:hypothetical protein